MAIRALALALCSTLLISSCASAPPARVSSDSAGVAIHVKVRAPVRVFSQEPQQVLFVRLSGPGGAPESGELMPSNYASGGYLYLLNAAPGTYVAVTCFKEMEPGTGGSATAAPGLSVSFRPGATNFTTYFPEAMIRETEITVKPGEIAFMGDFVVDQYVGLKDADPTQRAYYTLFGGSDEEENFLANALGGDYHYRGTLHESDHGSAAQEDFERCTNMKLAEAGWKPGGPAIEAH